MMLLLTVWVVPTVPITRMPRMPAVVPVPWRVIDPMLLPEMSTALTKLTLRMPWIAVVSVKAP